MMGSSRAEMPSLLTDQDDNKMLKMNVVKEMRMCHGTKCRV